MPKTQPLSNLQLPSIVIGFPPENELTTLCLGISFFLNPEMQSILNFILIHPPFFILTGTTFAQDTTTEASSESTLDSFQSINTIVLHSR